ncbi:uncharacterized protein [Rutidosis leptorrhynchoides]|uniref:uncharacterized protein n=1 Tax=Rutidosis leptorrhynchoides TaxID=125765 RepID=UPI003A9A4CE4
MGLGIFGSIGDGISMPTMLLITSKIMNTIDVKSKSSCSSPQSARKKTSSRLSFRWREGQYNLSILSRKGILRRPIAGSQVPYCPIAKKMSDCWSPLDPSAFKVRGHNYLRY